MNHQEEKHTEQPDRRLRVAVMAYDIIPGEVEENLHRCEKMLEELPQGIDVVVFPELFTTAFMRDTGRLIPCAEFRDGPTMRTVAAWADRYNCLVAGSYIAKECIGNGQHQYYNRGFMLRPGGLHTLYDKHHLFCLSPEAQLMTHGHRRRPVIEWRGWNVSILICYELRFPVWSRNVDMLTDIMLVPANWPMARGYAWQTLLKARAIENQCVVAGADRSGSDDYGDYDGCSIIADELGRQIAPPLASYPLGCPPPTAKASEIATPYGPILLAELSLAKLHHQRKWLPTVRDADTFTIHPRDPLAH